MRVPLVICVVGLLVVCAVSLLTPSPPAATEAPEWDTYRDDQAELSRLDATGRELRWSAPVERGSTRLFLSNHPESIGMPRDPRDPEGSRWPPATMEGTLWADEAEGADRITYQVFISHQNWFAKPIYIGLVISNLAPEGDITVTGRYVSTTGDPADDERTAWANMTMVGKRNAYADLSGTQLSDLTGKRITAGGPTPPHAVDTIHWKVEPGATLGARLRLEIGKASGQSGPVRCRVATVWAWKPGTLVRQSPLIPLNGPHPRGSWATSEVQVDNHDDPFDLAVNDTAHGSVRWLRLCQPVYDAAGKKTGYRRDVVYLPEKSFNPSQAKLNNGMYGVRTHAILHVTNSGKREETVGVYLRYPDKRLEGSYIGAATTYRYDAEKRTWEPDTTRAVDLSRRTYYDPATRRELQRDWWFATTCLATYTVQPGERKEIPLTLTHDFPAMLPLAIVLRKEAP